MMCRQFFTDCITLIGDATLVEFYLVLEFNVSSPLIGSRSHRDYWCTNFTDTRARSYAGIVSPIGSTWRDVIRRCHNLTQSALIVRLTTWATKCSVDWHLGCPSLARKRPVCYSSNVNSSGQALLSTCYRSHHSATNCCLPASPVPGALLYIYHGDPPTHPICLSSAVSLSHQGVELTTRQCDYCQFCMTASAAMHHVSCTENLNLRNSRRRQHLPKNSNNKTTTCNFQAKRQR